MENKLSDIKAIKMFFEVEPYGRKVEMAELKALSAEERAELGQLAREALKALSDDERADFGQVA